MKKLFEGRGKATEVKYGDVENSWKDAYFYISSNELPKQSTYKPGSKEYAKDWEPFLERIEFVKHQHYFNSEKDKPQFTFSHMCHLWLMWHEGDLDEGSFSYHPHPEADEMVHKRARRNDDNSEQGQFSEPTLSPTGQV